MLSCHWPRSNGAHQLWTRTSKAVRQNQTFLLQVNISDIHCSDRKLTQNVFLQMLKKYINYQLPGHSMQPTILFNNVSFIHTALFYASFDRH